jgi:anti-sigma regulatory factor (Ser/Thr protein kinase)
MSGGAPSDAPGNGAAPSAGFQHEALIFSSDEDYLAAAVPFLRGGLEAGEPTLLSVSTRHQRLLEDALGADAAALSVLAPGEYSQPYSTIRFNHMMLRDRTDNGAARVRMLGAVPHGEGPAAWHEWARYEAAINHLYATLPVWGMCPYDTRDTADDVLVDVRRTHPLLAGAGDNADYVNPAEFVAERDRAETDPLETEPADLELDDPSPREARRAAAELAADAGLGRADVDGIEVAVGEVVTNAWVHGRPPVAFRAWAGEDRLLVSVRDQGTGPADPFAGYLPGNLLGRDGGFGLNLVYQLCRRASLAADPDGFTVRMSVGAAT